MEALEPIIIILELCWVCLPDPTVFIFFSIGPNALSIILEQPNMRASPIKKQGTGEFYCFTTTIWANYLQAIFASLSLLRRHHWKEFLSSCLNKEKY